MKKPTTFTKGRKAEAEAVVWLKSRGHEVVDQNWRARFCEIDIITRKDGSLCFVEVKYRINDNQGSPLSYITKSKVEQMTKAALIYVTEYEITDDWSLYGLGVNSRLEVEDFVEIIS